MKRYVHCMIIVCASFGTYIFSVQTGAAQEIVIVPTTIGPNSIVDAIKKYSDLTYADAEKYKLLKLGHLDFVAALALAGYATHKTGTIFGKSFSFIYDYTPTFLMETLPGILQKPESWVGIGALGAAALSYTVLYPRIRMGVINRVQNFIDLCNGLTIAQEKVTPNTPNPFPADWNIAGDIGKCKAINNLVEQANTSLALLNQIGPQDKDVRVMLPKINQYIDVLEHNKNVYSYRCGPLLQHESTDEDVAMRRAGAKAQVFGMQLKNVNTALSIIKKVGGFLYTGAKDIMGWSAANPGPAGLMGVAYYLWTKSGAPAAKATQ